MLNFYVDLQDTSCISFLYTPAEKKKFFETPIKVPVLTLDKWAELQNVSHIDFLYLDMQGAEGDMLKASPTLLKTVKVIELEFYTYPVYEGIMFRDEIKTFLEDAGFKTLYLEPEENGEAIFVRK